MCHVLPGQSQLPTLSSLIFPPAPVPPASTEPFPIFVPVLSLCPPPCPPLHLMDSTHPSGPGPCHHFWEPSHEEKSVYFSILPYWFTCYSCEHVRIITALCCLCQGPVQCFTVECTQLGWGSWRHHPHFAEVETERQHSRAGVYREPSSRTWLLTTVLPVRSSGLPSTLHGVVPSGT